MKRKQFLHSLAWIVSGAYVAGCTPISKLGINGNVIKGKVVSGNKALPDVVVSDGFTVMQTDANGMFKFTLHHNASHVFISTPAGYEFKEQKFITRQYVDISNKGKGVQTLFQLTPLSINDNEHQFIIWADPQVKNKEDVQKMMQQSVPDVKHLIEKHGNNSLVHGITVGDIVWDNHDLFYDYEKAVAEMGIPFFQCLGNHDMDYNQVGDEGSDITFKKHFGPAYYSFNRGKVHYVVMDNVRYLGKDREYDGFIQQEQLDWLARDLSFVPKDHLLIICMHIPIHKGTKNKEDLYKILEGRLVHIMSGHTHYNVNKITGNIYEHNHGTVCGAWWTGPICGDGTPNGYGVYKVNGTDLSWYYKSTGEDAGHQMKIYVKDYDANYKQVVANVWNYDDAWTTACWVDGKQQVMEQFEGWDVQASATMLGPNLPAKRGFAEPALTSHLFKTLVPVQAKEVIVKTTDRFGKMYEQKHTIS